MISTKKFVKATSATLAACMLMACGGDDSESTTDQEKTSFTYTTDTHSLTISLPSAGAKVGQSVFPINVQDNAATAVENLNPMMMPMMAMAAGHQHSAPNTGCTETDANGDAECTVYFLMPSEMNNVAMGTWNLNFTLADNDEVISYSPSVQMAMGDTALAKLKGGANDQIPTMTMHAMAMSDMTMDEMPNTEPRTYFIFNNGISGMVGNQSIELFIASKESMMSFPTLEQGLVLNAQSNNELTVETISVEVSTDNLNWAPANAQGSGIWQADNLTDLETSLYVKLTVNGEVKTTDGLVEGDLNSSAVFTLAADSMSDMDM
jgi:hypothetical protein